MCGNGAALCAKSDELLNWKRRGWFKTSLSLRNAIDIVLNGSREIWIRHHGKERRWRSQISRFGKERFGLSSELRLPPNFGKVSSLNLCNVPLISFDRKGNKLWKIHHFSKCWTQIRIWGQINWFSTHFHSLTIRKIEKNSAWDAGIVKFFFVNFWNKTISFGNEWKILFCNSIHSHSFPIRNITKYWIGDILS